MSDSTSACSGWDNGSCVGTPYCPPRCPRFIDAEGTSLLMRTFEEGDLEPLISMYDCLDDESRTRGIPPKGRESIERWLDNLIDRGWHLIALDDTEVVGHVGIVPATADSPEGLVFVADAYQGRGVGGELLRQLFAYAAAREHDAILLDVARHNRRAVHAFTSVGFAVEHRNIDEVLLSLTMDDPVVTEARLPPAERAS